MNADSISKSTSSESKFYPTFFLCLFLGVLGAHRFYTGKVKSGILQLLTCGGFGIWAFVDLVLILLGKFKSKNNIQIQNANPKVSWTIFAVAIIIGITSRNIDSEGGTSSRPHTQSPSFSESDVAGTWVSDKRGQFGSGIFTLYSNGTGAYAATSTSDAPSSCQWSIRGHNVMIDLGDGGQAMSFQYRDNNTLIAGNGLVLHRQ